MRKRKDGGLSLTTITKMLDNVKTPKTYTQLRRSSTPKLPTGFIKYLHFCIIKGLMTKQMLSVKDYNETLAHSQYHRNVKSTKPFRPIYMLSDRGRDFLEMIG